jgi:serine/threonine protein kinase
MEERYEIRGKIGQGGLGAVYRGYDTRMSREVAIKRIPKSGDDPALQEESTRQLIKEAGALASLQHPHIVTVYDVGSDEDGPYVVMELISGKTLDELIENAPLTWPDFRELAMQTQEALIAAQELNLIHSDLKPSNLMLTWLPSGKFQIKIVDFGLASLAQSQTKEELETMEAVFGSIFFMPPEQFERAPLDARSDMYSMGCVYYQALTGTYPFDGANGNEVMAAHLHHKVKPIGEVRSGLPMWACDWIMWHLNRLPEDRPGSAREALQVFLQNDKVRNPPMSTGIPKPVAAAPRPRLIIPGAEETGPATQSLAKAKLVATSQVALAREQASITKTTAPQPLAPPEGFKPSVHTSLHELPEIEHVPTGGLNARRPSGTQRGAFQEKKPFKLGKNAKIGIGVAAGILLLILGLFLMKLAGAKRDSQMLADLVAQAENASTTEVKVDQKSLRLLLEAMIRSESSSQLQGIGKALTLAKASDATDVDARIADFATKRPELPPEAKEILISEVLRTRNNPVIMPAMLQFAASSGDPALVVAALQSVRDMAGDAQFDTFLKLIETTNNNLIRDAAEQNIVEILKKTGDLKSLNAQLKAAQESSVKQDIQKTLQRLLSFCDSIRPRGK